MKFLARLYESTRSYCCHSDVGFAVVMGVTLIFLRQRFYVMGKALPGELSCMGTGLVISYSNMTLTFLAHLEEVQPELLYYHRRWRWRQRL